MIDTVVRIAPIVMIALAGTVGVTLNQLNAADTGDDFEVPVTAQTLTVTEVNEVAAPPVHSFKLPAEPAEVTTGMRLSSPARTPKVEKTTALEDDDLKKITEMQNAEASSDPVILDDCEPLMRIDAAEQATLRLLVSAPCHIGQRIEIAHHALAFASIVDSDGGFMTHIPALMADGAVAVTFEDGQKISDAKAIEGLESYRRVALLVSDASDLELHVLEAGATYGDDAHIHPGNQRGAEDVVAGKGGRLMMLGQADLERPMMAQVYSTMKETIIRDGVPEMTVEASVTQANCGLDRRGTVLTPHAGSLESLSFEVAVPECDAVGDFLVLPGLFNPLQLAAAEAN